MNSRRKTRDWNIHGWMMSCRIDDIFIKFNFKLFGSCEKLHLGSYWQCFRRVDLLISFWNFAWNAKHKFQELSLFFFGCSNVLNATKLFISSIPMYCVMQQLLMNGVDDCLHTFSHLLSIVSDDCQRVPVTLLCVVPRRPSIFITLFTSIKVVNGKC